MNLAQFQKAVASPEPAYLLVTEQDYLKKKVYEFCLRQVAEEARSFDWAVFDLSRDSPAELLKAARTLPWRGPRRWIYVRKADQAPEALAGYLKDPSPRTVLVLEVKGPLGQWPTLPAIEMDEAVDPSRWILRKAQSQGYQIEPQAVRVLLELAGEDFARLDVELEKQFLWQLESRMITLDSVRRLTFQAQEHDVFVLIDFIAAGRPAEALRFLNRLYDSGIEPLPILSLLYGNFRRLLVAAELLDQGVPFQSVLSRLKLWSYKNREREVRSCSRRWLAEVLVQLSETDRLFKTTSTDAKLHLERLVIDTCRARSL